MLNKLLLLAAIYSSILYTSCNKTHTYNNHVDYVNALTNHQDVLIKENTWDNLNFKAQYIPQEKYTLESVVKSNQPLDTLKYQEKLSDVSDRMIFVLKLSDLGGSILGDSKYPDEAYFAKLQYFIDPARYDIKLIHGLDTLMSHDYHFERYYDYAPYNTAIVTFNTADIEVNKDLELLFEYPFTPNEANDLTHFHFKINDLNQLPQLNI